MSDKYCRIVLVSFAVPKAFEKRFNPKKKEEKIVDGIFVIHGCGIFLVQIWFVYVYTVFLAIF